MGAVGCESSREWRLGFKERFARMEKWKIPPQKVAKGVGEGTLLQVPGTIASAG